MLKKDLLEVCQQKGIDISPKALKEDIIKKIQEYQQKKENPKVDLDPFKGEY